MRKHLKNKLDKYVNAFKRDVIEWVVKNQGSNNDNSNHMVMNDMNIANFTKFVNNYESFNDVTATVKKTQTGVGICNARRADGEQCTRRIQCNNGANTQGLKFCGTHYKGVPYGEIENQVVQSVISKKCVYVVNINGIGYYVDDKDNIYKSEDVYRNTNDPQIIATRIKLPSGEYDIKYL